VLGKIVEIQLAKVTKRAAKMGITLDLTNEAIQLLANEGFDSVYGARPLKRTIQRLLLDELSMLLLDGKIAEGDSVRVNATGDQLVFDTNPHQNGIAA
ncbi:MAG: ATP-dependent chaperone ClpB, partial [Verrucomicrobiales bacterium]